METVVLEEKIDAMISAIKEGNSKSRVRLAVFDLINRIKEDTEAEILERLQNEYGLKRPIRRW